MHRLLPLLIGLVGCSDYDIARIERDEEKSWFEETSDSFQEDFDPGVNPDDEQEAGAPEDDNPADEDVSTDDDEQLDTGGWTEDEEVPAETDPDPADVDPGTDDGPDSPGPSDDDEPSDGPSGSEEDEPSEGPGAAVMPATGEVVITELMIHPRATDDAQGEWVEIHNASSTWIDLSGSMLADRGVDGVEIEAVSAGSLVVEPGGYLTICAEADFWDNGGVTCDGTFYYRTLGGGFALSNIEDEVKLISAGGWLLDEVRYNEGFSVEGEALGLDPDMLTVSANDVMGNWCEQTSMLSFGDGGTPGEPNDPCY